MRRARVLLAEPVTPRARATSVESAAYVVELCACWPMRPFAPNGDKADVSTEEMTRGSGALANRLCEPFAGGPEDRSQGLGAPHPAKVTDDSIVPYWVASFAGPQASPLFICQCNTATLRLPSVFFSCCCTIAIRHEVGNLCLCSSPCQERSNSPLVTCHALGMMWPGLARHAPSSVGVW